MSANIVEISTENIPLANMGGAVHTYEEDTEDVQVTTPLTYTRRPRIPPVRARMNTYDEYTPSGLHGHHSNEAGQQAFPPYPPPEAFPGTQFVRESTIWDVCNNEARIVDNELIKNWMSSLNFLLLFASIFSAVLSAFIIESKNMLQQDPADVMVAVLILLANNSAAGTHNVYESQPFVPTYAAISINCLFFCSLSASLAAALASVVVSQWVVEYDGATSRGGASPRDRVKRRHFRFRGVVKWKMGEIIAALPFLLYCSVILFFAGLTQWMWSLHRTVGYIVAVSAILIAAFYVVSMVLSAFFPSSPFRTPVSKPIYYCLHLILSIFLSISQLFAFKGVAAFMERSHFSKPSMEGRDNDCIQTDPTLVSDALSWLAGHISLSADSYRRLRLLIQELLASSSEQQVNEAFRTAPLWEVFDVLGSRQLNRAMDEKYNEEDKKELELIMSCLHDPQLGPVIAPGKRHEYPRNQAEDNDGSRHKEHRPSEPINTSYFILQNLSIPHDPIPADVQLRHRFAYIQHAQTAAYNVPQMDDSWREIQQRLENGHIQFIEAMELFADALAPIRKDAREEHTNWLLLSLKAGVPVINQPMCFPTPSTKAMIMPESPVMTRLRCRRVEWIHSWRFYPEATVVNILKALTSAQLRSLPPLWRFEATDDEVDDLLDSIDPQDRRMMAGLISAERRNNHHVDALKAFDDLLVNRDGLTDAVLELVFEDLGLPKSPLHLNQYTDEHKEMIQSMRHPFLRLVACAVTGTQWEDTWSQELANYIHKQQFFAGWERVTRYCFKEHYSLNLPTIWNLRTRLWPYFEQGRIRRLLTDALTDYAPAGFTLSSLESEFEKANAGIEHGGDRLLAMIHLTMIRTEEYSTHCRFTDTLDDESLWSVWSRPNIFSISALSEANLSKLCHTIEEDQTRLIRLLIELLRTERWRLTVGHVRKIIVIAMKHLVVDDMQSPPDCRQQLVNMVIQLRDPLLLNSPDFPDAAAKELFRLECVGLIDGLSPLT